jgi:hypothetical protein
VRQAAEVPLASPGKEGGLANVVREDIMMEEEDEIRETIVGDFFDEFTTRAATGRLLSTHHTSPTASLPPSSADCTLAPPLQAPYRPTYMLNFDEFSASTFQRQVEMMLIYMKSGSLEPSISLELQSLDYK